MMKKILTGLALSVVGIFVSCSSGDDNDMNSAYYVSEQQFINGAIEFKFQNSLATFDICPEQRPDGYIGTADDDDSNYVIAEGTMLLDTSDISAVFNYTVSGETGTVDVKNVDGALGDSVTSLYTQNVCLALGLPWDYDSVEPKFDTIETLKVTFDFVTGLCYVQITYWSDTNASTMAASNDPTWMSYYVNRS